MVRAERYYDRIVALLETPDFVQPKEHRNEVRAPEARSATRAAQGHVE